MEPRHSPGHSQRRSQRRCHHGCCYCCCYSPASLAGGRVAVQLGPGAVLIKLGALAHEALLQEGTHRPERQREEEWKPPAPIEHGILLKRGFEDLSDARGDEEAAIARDHQHAQREADALRRHALHRPHARRAHIAGSKEALDPAAHAEQHYADGIPSFAAAPQVWQRANRACGSQHTDGRHDYGQATAIAISDKAEHGATKRPRDLTDRKDEPDHVAREIREEGLLDLLCQREAAVIIKSAAQPSATGKRRQAMAPKSCGFALGSSPPLTSGDASVSAARFSWASLYLYK